MEQKTYQNDFSVEEIESEDFDELLAEPENDEDPDARPEPAPDQDGRAAGRRFEPGDAYWPNNPTNAPDTWHLPPAYADATFDLDAGLIGKQEQSGNYRFADLGHGLLILGLRGVELADGEVAGDEDASVDVGGVPHRACDSLLLDEHAPGPAELPFVHLGGHRIDRDLIGAGKQ